MAEGWFLADDEEGRLRRQHRRGRRWARTKATCRWCRRCAQIAQAEGAEVLVISAKVEEEIAQLDPEEQARMFLEDMGLGQSGLDRLVQLGYHLLGLISYLTAGPKEVRAWTIPEGTQRARRPPARSIRTSSAASSARRSSPMTTWCANGHHERLQGKGPGALRGQGLRDEGRRRDAVPLQRMISLENRPGILRANASFLLAGAGLVAAEFRRALCGRVSSAVYGAHAGPLRH